jgi:hypothetical protein
MIPFSFYCNSARSSSCSFWGRSLVRRPIASPLCFCDHSFLFLSLSFPFHVHQLCRFLRVRGRASLIFAISALCCSQRRLQIARIALSDLESGAWQKNSAENGTLAPPPPLCAWRCSGVIGFCSCHVNFLKLTYPRRTHTAIRMVEFASLEPQVYPS